jgi:hypothetical protein
MASLLIPAFQAGMSLLQYYRDKKHGTPAFDRTEEGKRLKRVIDEGLYSPTVRSKLLAPIARDVANRASIERAKAKGELIASGMDDGIAGKSLLTQPGMKAMEIISDKGEMLESQNELTKEQALDEYSFLKDKHNRTRLNESRERNANMVSGLFGVGINAVGNLRASAAEKLAKEGATNKTDVAWLERMGFTPERIEEIRNSGDVGKDANLSWLEKVVGPDEDRLRYLQDYYQNREDRTEDRSWAKTLRDFYVQDRSKNIIEHDEDRSLRLQDEARERTERIRQLERQRDVLEPASEKAMEIQAQIDQLNLEQSKANKELQDLLRPLQVQATTHGLKESMLPQYNLVQGVDEQGNPVYGNYNPRTGRIEPVQGITPGIKGQQLTITDLAKIKSDATEAYQKLYLDPISGRIREGAPTPEQYEENYISNLIDALGFGRKAVPEESGGISFEGVESMKDLPLMFQTYMSLDYSGKENLLNYLEKKGAKEKIKYLREEEKKYSKSDAGKKKTFEEAIISADKINKDKISRIPSNILKAEPVGFVLRPSVATSESTGKYLSKHYRK